MDPINDITKKVIRNKIVSRRLRKIRKLELRVEDDTKNSSSSNSENELDINGKDFQDLTSNTNLNVQNNFTTQYKVSLNETNNVYESEKEPNECNVKNAYLSEISESESNHYSSTEYELSDSDNNDNEDKQSDSEIENNDISIESPIRLAVKNWAMDCKVLYSHIDSLTAQVTTFEVNLDQLKTSLTKQPSDAHVITFSTILKKFQGHTFPSDTLENFNAFDTNLKENQELYNDLKSFFISSINTTHGITDSLSKILKCFVSKHVLTLFTAQKASGSKLIFSITTFYKCVEESIIEAYAQDSGKVTESNFVKRSLGYVINNCVNWGGKRQKRSTEGLQIDKSQDGTNNV